MFHAREDYERIQDPAGIIPEKEPVFLLRGQDKAAPATLEMWAILNRELGGDETLSELALEHADRMRMWQGQNVCKLADRPQEKYDPEQI